MPIADGIVGLISGINQRKRDARTRDALANYMVDPQGSIQALMDAKANPELGINLSRQRVADEAAARKLKRDEATGDLDIMAKFFRNLPEGASIDAAMTEATPFLRDTLGVSDNGILNLKTALAANPGLLQGLDDDTFRAITKDRYTSTVATPGAHVLRGGKVIDAVPFAKKTVTTRGGGGASRTDIFDPNIGSFVTEGGGDQPPVGGAGAGAPVTGGALTVDALRPHFVAQESDGDYTVVSPQGAMGRYQVMPATGRTLATRLGLAWRPDMMRKDDAASRRYQDAIGNAAIQEAIDNGNGDIRQIASYYHGGSDRRQWGPKTRRYAEDMAGRLGGGAAPAAGGSSSATSISMPAAPPKPGKSYRAATKEEIAAAGYPAGTAAQVDQDGKMVNLKTPTAAATKEQAGRADRARQLVDQTTKLVREVGRLRNHPGLEQSQGFIRGLLPSAVLGQQATNFRNDLESLKSNIGLNKLMEFKAGSSQGASGFGNLSNAEGERLERNFGNLAKTTDPTRIREIFDDILRDAAAILRRQTVGFKSMPQQRGPAVGAVQDGYRFLGGDAGDQANWEKVQ